MNVGDLVTIKKSANSVGSIWFKNTRDKCTPMLVIHIDEDHALHRSQWRIFLTHPEDGLVYIISDHLKVHE